jgi:anti-anti-sigma factor
MLGTCTSNGDIDRASAAAFGAQIYDTIDNADETLVSVDCSGVTFMDSAGYHVLVDATRYAAQRGHTLVIRNPSHSCAMLLRLCDMESELRIDALTAEHFGRGAIGSRMP